MSRTLPPIFLLVSAFLVNLTLSRLVALEREQIGLLKALGYGNARIVAHYIKFVVVIAVIGIANRQRGRHLARRCVSRACLAILPLPVSGLRQSPEVYAIAAVLSLVAACWGRCGRCASREAAAGRRDAAARSAALPKGAARTIASTSSFPSRSDDVAQLSRHPVRAASRCSGWRSQRQF